MSGDASSPKGFVSLVGAGPGDPDLLTLAGQRALKRADVVLYDRLASPALLAQVAVEGQERIHVGKMDGPGHAEQTAIDALIIKRAAAGQRVVRLKGGDPFVLGRGGEEAQACISAGIPFEVIPGVSSAIAAPAYAGVPVTHRDVASGVCILTGHERADSAYERVDWSSVAGYDGTIVVLMGVKQVARWVRGLLRGGRPATTPVALIRWATTPRQETLVSTLGRVVEEVAQAQFKPPAVAVVGGVVALREHLSWLEGRPLFRTTIALTHPPRDGDLERMARLRDAGAHVMHLPTIRQLEVSPMADHGLQHMDATDVMFTSASAVRFFATYLESQGLDARWLAGRNVWSVGPVTGRALRRHLGVRPDEVPARHSAADLVQRAMEKGLDASRHVLFPRGYQTLDTLPDGLAKMGVRVTGLTLYRTTPMPDLHARLLDALEAGLNLATVASPSAADALCDALEQAGCPLSRLPVAAIGPTTAAQAQKRGLTVDIVAPTATLDDLIEALVEHGRAAISTSTS